MQRVRDLLARDLDQKIEEIIKLDQRDEESVYREITEYIATDRIREQYRQVLTAIAEAPRNPDEKTGVWVSGFFGSGKSSFAKNLGYVLANREVLGCRAAELFKRQAADSRIADLIDFINTAIPTEVVMFDVVVDRAVKKATEQISEIMYTVLLRELDYAEDYDIAELEIELESEGRLEDFSQRCARLFGIPWRTVRKGAQRLPRASAILHDLEPPTYPEPDTWAKAMVTKRADISVGKIVERAFELPARRRPGKALVFIIDEVGQYVARSADKIEDLRALMEELGKESKNRVRANKAVAPIWVVVTSQEKLDEVVSAIDSRRVEIARLQDRFHYMIDLAPADIREVATKRVLAKKPEAVPVLQALYRQAAGLLASACRLERTSRRSEVTEDDFVQFYPYLPHFMELSIDIVSGIRLQPGAPKHLGGSNRTIIKQAYEMLVSERTHVADRPVGSLVSLDLIFELVEGNLSTERQKDISDVTERFKDNPDDRGWAARVAKAICLLEFVRDLPRREENIAALLLDEVGKSAPLDEVKQAIQRLVEAKFIRNADEGYKIQTAQEKNWETERQGHLEPKPQERNAIKREVLGDVFSDAGFKTYRFKDLRTFRTGLSVDGEVARDEGQILISILTAEGPEEFSQKLAEARDESRTAPHQDDIYWVTTLDDGVLSLIANLHASRQMTRKYEDLRSKGRVSQVELDCLSSEKDQAAKYQGRLKDKIQDAIAAGAGVFRGIERDGSSLGKTAHEALRGLLDLVVPDLYPKLEMGARPLKGTEAEDVLKAANLAGLPQVFYGGETGLNLVVKEGQRFIPNLSSDVATEVMNYLVREDSYGTKVTGKSLEDRFGGLGYGWERDLLRMVLAVLLRAGAIEVTYQGRRYASHQDPLSRVPFTNNNVFRSASFAPRAAMALETLTRAAKHYEDITGTEVDVEAEAVASALKQLAGDEKANLEWIRAVVVANGLPTAPSIGEYEEMLTQIISGAADDCVRVLAGQGKSLKNARDRMRKATASLDGGGLETIRRGRLCIQEMWPALGRRTQEQNLRQEVEELAGLIQAEDFYERLPAIRERADSIIAAYTTEYSELHSRRVSAFSKAVEEVRAHSQGFGLSAEALESVLSVLSARACDSLDLPPASVTCTHCKAGLGQMEADLAALPGLKTDAVVRIQELAMPRKATRRVRLSDLFPAVIDSEEIADRAVEQLREQLHKLLADGITVIVE